MARKTWSIQQIKDMRLARHWSQEELAEESGLSTRTIQRIEQGQRVDMTSVKLLASALGLSTSELIGEIQYPVFTKSKYVNREQFIFSLVGAIILVVCMFLMALFAEEGDDMWFEFMITVMVVIHLMSYIADKTLYPGATKDFIQRTFPQEHKIYDLLPASAWMKGIVWFLVNLLFLSLLFPEFF